jgi:DNA/RNA endonuclease YhcR with UshA esterase domain
VKTVWSRVVAVAAVSLMAQVPVWAHHSFAAEFDAKKSITLTGTVASIKWTNPHAHISVEVKDATGTVTSWDFEMGSPNALMRRGWSRSSLKPGDMITVNGYLAKDGSHLANARSVMLGDGRTVFAGSSIETAPAQ